MESHHFQLAANRNNNLSGQDDSQLLLSKGFENDDSQLLFSKGFIHDDSVDASIDNEGRDAYSVDVDLNQDVNKNALSDDKMYIDKIIGVHLRLKRPRLNNSQTMLLVAKRYGSLHDFS